MGRGRKKTLAQKGSSCYSFGWPLPLPRKPVALGMGSENSESQKVSALWRYTKMQAPQMFPQPRVSLVS